MSHTNLPKGLFPEFHWFAIRELDTFLNDVKHEIANKYPESEVTKAIIGLPELFIPVDGIPPELFPRIVYQFDEEDDVIYLILRQWNWPKHELSELYCEYSEWKDGIKDYCELVIKTLEDLPKNNADLHNESIGK